MWPFQRLFKSRERRYCAFCKAPRRIYWKKHISLTNVLAAIAFSGAAMFSIWSEVDGRGLVILGVFLVGAEVFVYMRWRVGVVCQLCGFDPVLYKKSPALAAERVRRFFKEQAENPSFWLTKSPLLDVHRRIRASQKQALKYEAVARKKAERSGGSSVRGPIAPVPKNP